MLVPHEPELDPRIQWVAQLCRRIGRTEIIGAVSPLETSTERERPEQEYDGTLLTDRVKSYEYASATAKGLARLLSFLYMTGFVQRYFWRERERGDPVRYPKLHALTSRKSSCCSNGLGAMLRSWIRGSVAGRAWQAIDHTIGSVFRFLSVWSVHNVLSSALYRRARALSVIPRLLICHDVLALVAGARIKQMYGCPLLYDAHELWPEADLLAKGWERRVMTWVEGRSIRHADVVVTVTPQLARHLEERYGIAGVVCAPNAAPTGKSELGLVQKPVSLPLKFLYQGQLALRRGLEELLQAWEGLVTDSAVLYLRCPANDFLSYLRNQYRHLLDEQRVVVLPAVREAELVMAASFADVGIIPYVGPNLNHVYCCPNKLSQYMQAGLAVLSNRLSFVSEVISRYQCGLIYDAEKPETVAHAVRFWINHPDELQAMKARASLNARREFNWECQSQEYQRAVAILFEKGVERPQAAAGK